MMKAMFGFAVAVALVSFAGADDKKKEFDAKKLEGKWTVTEGKKAGTALGDDAKKGHYVFEKGKISIYTPDGEKPMFVLTYTIDAKASPVAIDMEITEGPGDGVKGTKAKGIVEFDGDDLKICYDAMGGDRPAKFDGDKAYYFKLKMAKKDEKKKAEKKDDK